MEFTCVLSVNGSLASYRVCRESEHRYLAVLNGSRTDLPAEITLEKNENGWASTPVHEILCAGLSQAVDAGGGADVR